MGTYDGLSIPIYGEYYRYNSSQSQVLYVENDGVTNWTIAKTAADNALALTLTDGSTLTSGYVQGYYCSLTTSGSYTTGNTQINAFAVDLLLGGTVGCEAEGMYIYVAASGSPTVTSGDVSGLVVYMADLGASASYMQDLFLHWGASNAPSGLGSYILVKGEGGNAPEALIGVHGQFPTYFVRTIASQTGMVQSITPSATITRVLVCNLNGSTFWIPLYPASA